MNTNLKTMSPEDLLIEAHRQTERARSLLQVFGDAEQAASIHQTVTSIRAELWSRGFREADCRMIWRRLEQAA